MILLTLLPDTHACPPPYCCSQIGALLSDAGAAGRSLKLHAAQPIDNKGSTVLAAGEL